MKKCFTLLLLVLAGTGCAGRYNVAVNGFTLSGQPLQLPNVSTIRVIEDSNAPNPFLEKEVAAKIERLLGTKGFSTAAAKTDYYLLFDYGIDSGRTIVGSTPVYHPGDFATMDTVGAYGGVSYSRFSTVHAPGYTTYVPYSATVYTRWLVLKLIDGPAYRDANKTTPLWIGEISSVGSSSDVREAINYMLIGAFDYFGENTGKRVNIGIRKRDERIQALIQR